MHTEADTLKWGSGDEPSDQPMHVTAHAHADVHAQLISHRRFVNVTSRDVVAEKSQASMTSRWLDYYFRSSALGLSFRDALRHTHTHTHADTPTHIPHTYTLRR